MAGLRLTTRSISIGSGKGGVGKSTLVANLAYALQLSGARVLILDGDLGVANLDLMFGIKSRYHIGHLLDGTRSLSEIAVSPIPGITLISGGHGFQHLTELDAFQRRALLDAISELEHHYDFLLIDTAPGLASHVLTLNAAADTTLIVLTGEPASFADSYALIKLLNQDYGKNDFAIVTNFVKSNQEGKALFDRFTDVVTRFLHVRLDHWGTIPADSELRENTHRQRLILRQQPMALSSQAFLALASKMADESLEVLNHGGLRYFWGNFVGAA